MVSGREGGVRGSDSVCEREDGVGVLRDIYRCDCYV